VEGDSLDAKLKLTELDLMVPVGPAVIVVSGGVVSVTVFPL
jgi:hypothetical protein